MLNEKTLNILEENDITVYDRIEQGNEFCREVEFYSNADEDVIETIWYDGTDGGFIEGFRQLADDFDADEHAAMWIENRGNDGVPDDIRTLIDDAKYIKDTLLSVADQLEGINRIKHTYTVTIKVSNNEEEKTKDFEINAYSIEDTINRISDQLNI